MKEFITILRRFVPPYKYYLIFNILFNILSSILTLFSFAMIIPILEMLFNPERAVSYSFMEWGSGNLKDVAINNFYYLTTLTIDRYGASTTILLLGVVLIILTALKTGTSYLGSFFLIPLRAGVVRVMSKGEKKARRVSATEVLAGRSCWNEQIGEEEMLISAPSFFQVNTGAAEILIDLVLDALKPRPDELAMDLYCGAGTFTLPLARRADYVSAVESYGPAVRDLRRNLERAGLDNVDVIGGDAVREFPDADADVLVVDPPRAGLAPEAVDLIAETSARDVAYVSCDPATLARDLKRFHEQNVFEPVRITPVDLFPQTFHCETVVHLTRRA